MKTKKSDIQREEEYVALLKKRLASENYRNNVTKEEYEKTQLKYKKAKLKLRMLRGEV